jgi:hypothetical protein
MRDPKIYEGILNVIVPHTEFVPQTALNPRKRPARAKPPRRVMCHSSMQDVIRNRNQGAVCSLYSDRGAISS